VVCTVWWAAPVDPDDAPSLVTLLDGHERERLTRLRRAADRGRYLAAHALVRLALGGDGTTAAALTFDRTCACGEPHGKPVLPGGPGFSLSHAGDLVGVAVCPDGAVGLDVEQLRPLTDLAAMAGHVHSPAELARHGTPDQETFFRAWTRKEALLKATGEGLAEPMAAITLAPDGAVVEWAGHGPFWLRDLTPAPDHPAAVAGPGATTAPAVVEADGAALLRS
jgi:4'-phosphopantetheinyl transferase